MTEASQITFEVSFSCNNSREWLFDTNAFLRVLAPLQLQSHVRMGPLSQSGGQRPGDIIEDVLTLVEQGLILALRVAPQLLDVLLELILDRTVSARSLPSAVFFASICSLVASLTAGI